MFNTSRFFSSALALALAAFVGITAAQAATTKKPVAKTSKSSKTVIAKAMPSAAAPVAAAAAAPTSLSPEQVSIASIVQTGRINCELGQSVTITPDARTQGAFDLSFAGRSYDVVPVPSKTGAIRLENARSGIVYMQLANKSMLLNEREGRRMADDCISAGQQAVAAQMKAQNTPSVLDAPSK
jgi:hypothetical protein